MVHFTYTWYINKVIAVFFLFFFFKKGLTSAECATQNPVTDQYIQIKLGEHSVLLFC